MAAAQGALIGIGAPFFMVLGIRWVFSIPKSPKFDALFIAGAATAFVALIGEKIAWPVLDPLLPAKYAIAIHAFIMIALIEEVAKIALIYGQAVQHSRDYRSLAIVAAIIGAGFAGAENAIYIMEYGPGVILRRIFTATPFHICNAIVASRLLWMGTRQDTQWAIPAALLTAVLLHGLYDYTILTDNLGEGKFWFALAMTGALATSFLHRGDE